VKIQKTIKARRYASSTKLSFNAFTPIRRRNAPTTNTTFNKKWPVPLLPLKR